MSCTNWCRWTHPLQPRTWKVFIKESWREFTRKFRNITPRTFLLYWVLSCKWIQRSDQLASKFSTCQFSYKSTMNLNCKNKDSQPKTMTPTTKPSTCLEPSKFQSVWKWLGRTCPRVNMMRTSRRKRWNAIQIRNCSKYRKKRMRSRCLCL